MFFRKEAGGVDDGLSPFLVVITEHNRSYSKCQKLLYFCKVCNSRLMPFMW